MKTSFGEMDIILKADGKPQVEHLIFEREGRPHRHASFESFFVLKGTGKVYIDEEVFNVKPGSQVVIPPNSVHWMAPSENTFLEGLLWYHTCESSEHLRHKARGLTNSSFGFV